MKQLTNIFLFLSFVALIVITRWAPHPPNFSPLLAIAVFCGARFGLKPWAFLVPILGLFISDLTAGIYDHMAVVYLSLLPIVWVASQMPKQRVLNGLLACVFFFLATNFAVWWSAESVPSLGYAPTWQGLLECYAMALPFFRNTLLSTGLFLAVFEGVAWLLSKPAESLPQSDR